VLVVELSPREQTVVKLVAQGLRNKDIAAALGVQETTIKHRVSAIFDKVGVWNRVELAGWFHAHAGEMKEVQ
jgi:two-component system nitrate/nitrite response regulator NarL